MTTAIEILERAHTEIQCVLTKAVDDVLKLQMLTRDENVLKWLRGDLSFLCVDESVKRRADALKKAEDEWGRGVLRTRRPDLKLDKQWTNKFGEHICEEIYTMLGSTVTKPVKTKGYQPDVETESVIIEVKTQTYYTSGTAGEKILGVPFKYIDVPVLFSKSLVILCVGGAEKRCREEYGNLPGDRCSERKKELLDVYKRYNIHFVALTDLLSTLSPP